MMGAADRVFFERNAVEVAPSLLGALLTRNSPEGPVTLRITEVEAYLGIREDPGSHSFRGRTARNAVMFGAPLHLYTYFSYGMHVCANIVCSPEGQASGLLLRAGQIVDGLELARQRRGAAVPDRDLARGPARLTRALGIPLTDGGADLAAAPYSLELASRPGRVETSVRTGVSGPGGSAEYPWRFFVPNDPNVSPYRPSVPRKRSPKA